MLVRFAKLITDIRRDARLDAASASGNQNQPDGQDPFLAEGDGQRGVHEGESEMSEAVNDGEIKDRPVFAEPAVGQNRADNGIQ